MTRVLSGIQPTAGSFHLGNYLGALRNWATLQDTTEALFTVVDLHAITVPQDPAELTRNTRISFAQIVAAGIDPERSSVFVQSHVPEHTQLAWILMCQMGFGEASRMTQFKDKTAKGGAAQSSVGLFTYPALMAADILLYQADQVPVGADQRQHLELTRDLAQRFNTRYGPTFTIPEPYIPQAGARIMDLSDPTSKMSKSSEAGCVFLLDDPKKITKKIKSAVTDSHARIAYDPDQQPGVANLLTIIGACTDRTPEAVAASYDGGLYGQLKKDAVDAVLAVAEPFAQRTQDLLDDPAELDRMMARGAQKARSIAAVTLADAESRLGFVPLVEETSIGVQGGCG